MNNQASKFEGKKSDPQLQKKLLKTLKLQTEQLSQFIVRLSKHYEGVSPELDKELQKLRSHLGGQANFSLAEISIGKLTGLIMQNSDSLKKQSNKTISILENAVKQLQSRDNLPDDIKGEATQFLVNLQNNSSGIYSSLPQFEQVLDIYRLALDNQALFKKASIKPLENKENLSVSAQLHAEITEELRELIGQLSLSNKKDKQLAEVKAQLTKGLDHEALLECCLIIIKAIIRDVIKERNNAEKFVSGLHKSLSSVTSAVDKSIDESQNQFQLKMSASELMRGHIETIGHAVDKSQDLAELKKQAAKILGKLSESLEGREQAEKDEQLILMNLLSEMKNQLTSLEKETSEFKHRLIEQKYQSHHDPLTQIPNRTAYNERADLEFRRWKRHKNSLCIAVIDVDHFKKINDSYGHPAGDKTLQVIAQNIHRCLRSTDFLARWGGEEFVALFPQTSLEELKKPLETIRSQVERIPFKFKEKRVSITVSIGATMLLESDDINTAFERADKALYEAKNAGRNQCIAVQG